MLPPSSRATTRCAALVALLAALGCNRDSASRAPETASWRLSERPRLQVGSEEGPGPVLDGVYGGVIGRDGTVVIGNSGTAELQFFDESGRRTHVAGREGDGPGEFRAVSWLRRFRGDSLIVFDVIAQRFSVWSQSGAFAREFRIREAQGPARPIAVLADGHVLVSAENHYDPRRDRGLVRDQMHLSVVTPTGEPAGEIGRFAGAEWLLYKDANSFRASQFPFGKAGFADASGDHVVYASSDSAIIAVYDRAGTRVRGIRLPTAAHRELTRGEIDDVLGEFGNEGTRQEIRRQLRSAGTRVRAPAVGGLRVDASGKVWVRMPASGPGVSRWVVMSIEGEESGSVLMPDSWFPLDIQDSRVLLRETTDSGVHRVSLREVLR
ncbi:MAG TPA: hypothetical protein VGC13_27425 [Longimicrobium sp.]|jgi:hypothetical protein|uniref:hypothetical protein n=1 Tax=Longimicrobium sp. TaxID=2029185 RepID=UPI002ED8CA02